MINRKGMSQVLSLIVAASVLMMTALMVIMFTSGSLTGFFNDIGGASCSGAIENQCRVGATNVDPPSSCYNEADDKKEGVAEWVPENPDTEVSCSNVIN